jgi:hypothetical protein
MPERNVESYPLMPILKSIGIFHFFQQFQSSVQLYRTSKQRYPSLGTSVSKELCTWLGVEKRRWVVCQDGEGGGEGIVMWLGG